MLSDQEFAQQQMALGRRVHYHDGIWWEQVKPLYCKPVFEFRAFPAFTAKPRALEGFLGFSHQVCDPGDANRSLSWMILDGDNLRQFSLDRLTAKKRNQVRKGLKSCAISEITDIEPLLERMRLINVQQARRQARVDVPPAYYVKQADLWRKEIRSFFAHKATTWLGAFCNEELAAYMITIRAGDVVSIVAVKSHTEAMAACPVDALYFNALQAASRLEGCGLVVNGGPAAPSLDHFKRQFLFQPRTFWYYSKNERLYRFARASSEIGRKAYYSLKSRVASRVTARDDRRL